MPTLRVASTKSSSIKLSLIVFLVNISKALSHIFSPLIKIAVCKISISLVVNSSNNFNALVYYIGTHFDLSIYRFGMIIENTDLNLLLSSFVVIAYFIVLIVPTFVIFNKKDIKNT